MAYYNPKDVNFVHQDSKATNKSVKAYEQMVMRQTRDVVRASKAVAEECLDKGLLSCIFTDKH